MGIKRIIGEHKRIMFDTAPIIYFVEEHKEFGAVIDEIFNMVRGDFEYHAFSSVITLTEVLTHPLRQLRLDIVTKYQEFLLNSNNFIVYPIDSLIAQRAANLRAKYEIRTPDAIQLATAIENNGTLFVTNDKRLKKVKGIEVLVIAEYS